MKIDEQKSLCGDCIRQPECGCNSIEETDNYNLDEVWSKYRVRMKVVVWECPGYEKDMTK